MSKEFEQSLIIFICNHGFAYDAMQEARKSGASGGTILHGKSSVTTEKSVFFGIRLHSEKDLLLIVCRTYKKERIMQALVKNHGVTTAARGLCFSLKISESIGFTFN
ncbi:MAG: hypothetical protein RBS76_01695 [Acholeplasmatales bacterium]|jgi:hypothetical protein|nr:hypothetical protein [Acholeplasmataceae bacterium]MDY0115194.1 hypothetical protein [Acholeplasmatales bacterium]MCK9233667.1 hypothetical protein [Acholeplasmataceae bacterium]MCK9288944.1 hypothetical protein [Acholeplasmataceae bacterium]MCK9427538.1 hypothetical protein [Acholeplasmataceae bacterium]